MRHQNSVFHAVQKHVPWDAFHAAVERPTPMRGCAR
jgi:hypothetical protein